eukprot:31344_1
MACCYQIRQFVSKHFKQTLLLLYLLSLIPLSPYQLTWIQPTSPVFFNGGNDRIVSGYFNGSVWLIGGDPRPFDVLEYKVAHSLYITHNAVPDYIITGSQQWTVIGETIYIYGYEQFDGSNWLADKYIMTYNMADKSYNGQTITKKNTALLHPCITNKGNTYLFIVGGHIATDQDTLQIFNIVSFIWINDGPSMLVPRRSHACNVHNNELYVIGGYQAGSGYLNTVHVLDISDMSGINSMQWVELGAKLSVARESLRSVIHADFIYVLGGYHCCFVDCGGGGSRCPVSAVEIIDTLTKTITSQSNLTTGGIVSPCIVPELNKMFVFGGYTGSEYADTLQYSDMPPTMSPTSFPTSYPSKSPTMHTQSPTLTTNSPTSVTNSPTISTLSPTLTTDSPTSLTITFLPTIYPTNNPTGIVIDSWVYKESLNCADGFIDLDGSSSWYGIYCEKCPQGTAGTYGQCDKCGTLEEPNHTRTECEFTTPWWLYLLETVGAVSFVGGIGIFLYKKFCKKKSDTSQIRDGKNTEMPVCKETA